jgi:hypothetical protein
MIWAGGVVPVEHLQSPEFKPQSHQKKKNSQRMFAGRGAEGRNDPNNVRTCD